MSSTRWQPGTLHDAIATVLADQATGAATTAVIASEIKRRDLYRCKDGSFPPADQIRLRCRKPEYAHLFEMPDAESVRLLKVTP